MHSLKTTYFIHVLFRMSWFLILPISQNMKKEDIRHYAKKKMYDMVSKVHIDSI